MQKKTKINVDAIDETIVLFIPQGVQTDEEIQIPDKGYRDSKGGKEKQRHERSR